MEFMRIFKDFDRTSKIISSFSYGLAYSSTSVNEESTSVNEEIQDIRQFGETYVKFLYNLLSKAINKLETDKNDAGM